MLPFGTHFDKRLIIKEFTLSMFARESDATPFETSQSCWSNGIWGLRARANLKKAEDILNTPMVMS